MGTEITTKMLNHTVNEFWGGEKHGKCLQVTASGPWRGNDTVQEESFIQLTLDEASALHNDLADFIRREGDG